MTDDYAAFLRSKELRPQTFGFEVAEEAINPRLFPFQRKIVRWALRRGLAAVFAGTGLGKTGMQLEWARHVVRYCNLAEDGNGEESVARVLILAPLAVGPQTVREGAKFGIAVTQVRSQADVGGAGIYVTNYEMLDKFDPAQFVGVVLDESSRLKDMTGKTRTALIEAFKETPYRLACTATPAPNNHVELGNHAQFLGVLAVNEMLCRWFVNDTADTGNWRLKGHAADDFWGWVHTWAVSCDRPSDLGDFDDTGYVLPPLVETEHVVAADSTMAVPDGQLFRTGSLSATSLHKEGRLTTDLRAAEVAAVVGAEAGERWIVWCNTNYEADALAALIPGVVEVRGNMKLEEKERILDDFSQGRIRVLLTKPSIAGHGMNWQGIARVAFVGLSYSYEQLYQAIRRCWRFGQLRPVHVHYIRADTEGQVLDAIHKKQASHEEMKKAMIDAMRRVQLFDDGFGAKATVPLSVFAEGERWKLWRGDCVEMLRGLPDNTIALTVSSPPFSNLFIYSDAAQDMGNCMDDSEFESHIGFLARELFRVTKPGRLAALHVSDIPSFKFKDGFVGIKDFSGLVVRAFQAAGWKFHDRVTIWRDPVVEMQRTKALGLLQKTLLKDSTRSRTGMPDYVVVFRKWEGIVDGSESPEPVAHDVADFPIEQWQAWASPIWMDVNQTRVLDYREARDAADERHVCPLQLDVIERAIVLWSNRGDLVLDPFNGIGSTGHEALRLGRRYVGAELKESYCRMAAKVLAAAERDATAPTLFSGVGGRVA